MMTMARKECSYGAEKLRMETMMSFAVNTEHSDVTPVTPESE